MLKQSLDEVLKLTTSVVIGHQNNKDMLIQILLDLQNKVGWLPEEILFRVSEQLDVPLNRVYQIATFYKAFSLAPKGKHIIRVCMGSTCEVRGAGRLLNVLHQLLNVGIGETTPDMEFTLETERCLGCCAIAPVVVIDGHYHGKVNAIDLQRLLSECAYTAA